MSKLTVDYHILKNVIAKAYTIILDENGRGNREQIRALEPAYETLLKFQNLFNNLNLYSLFSIDGNQDIVKLCYRDLAVGSLYNRIATLYLIDRSHNPTNITLDKIIDDEFVDVYNAYLATKKITSEKYQKDLYPIEGSEDNAAFRSGYLDLHEKMLYLLNVNLVFYIKQIHDEIFGVEELEMHTTTDAN